MFTKFIKLFVSILVPLALGFVAGMYTSDAVQGWYDSLNRPSFNPPDWVFGPVWTMLYITMGVSFFIIWNATPTRERTIAIIVYLLQLVLNFAWTFLFFYYQQLGWALVEIAFLWLVIVFMLFRFYKVKMMAAWLNVPYLLWVSFATALTAAWYFLN